MAMEFVVEITHREIIKPSSSTPLCLQNFKLSLLDEVAPQTHISLVLWYPNNSIEAAEHVAMAEARSRILKKSLSETLTRFYTFAGRIKGTTVECNDEGADYFETRVNCLLQDILKRPHDCESLGKLLPLRMGYEEAAAAGSILLVQVNFFECGGMAIGVNLSHQIADLSTFKFFTKCWAAMARGSCGLAFPDFGTITSLFPPLDFPDTATEMDVKGTEFATRRLVFDASKVSMLKDQAASIDVPQPTRVEAVTALIWKCAMAAATSNRGGFKRPSCLFQAVNLRKRMNPPVPEYCTGNLVYGFFAQTSDCRTELQGLVKQLRYGIREFSENLVKNLQGSDAVSAYLAGVEELKNWVIRDDVDFYMFSSWCRFELYESADFGWGKPRWVSAGADANIIQVKGCKLMDSRDGKGIEAWLHLSEADMAFLERNLELLAFGSVNTSVKL